MSFKITLQDKGDPPPQKKRLTQSIRFNGDCHPAQFLNQHEMRLRESEMRLRESGVGVVSRLAIDRRVIQWYKHSLDLDD